MSDQFDFKKEWERTKAQLLKFSKEASGVAKKGEKELLKFTKKSKAHIDSTAITLKKEHLYHLIGKEYAQLKDPLKPSKKLEDLMKQLSDVEKEQKKLKRKLNVKKKTSKASESA